MLSKCNTIISVISIFLLLMINTLYVTFLYELCQGIHFKTMSDGIYVFVQIMFSQQVTPWFSPTYTIKFLPTIFFFIENIFFPQGNLIMNDLRLCRQAYTFIFKAELKFRNSILDTVFHLAFLRKLQNRLWKTDFTVSWFWLFAHFRTLG